ncbi:MULTISPECIES: SagB/ThcOx family dehydrogenase [Rhizobium]|uniref:SagB/ThcOx family dehydrogenase n=1 Tax=Rhizobium rhododendri TaxID=2506430 RepID=A0ABY8IRI9_9HYPH|nr:MULTISPECIES: SagB/ThcOx family dehydrogenase [Rhizobium]TQX84266.1 SagB/ThcOx family dehydrogenase [Rhizobium sp. rho-13.1]TQY07825.1 SagB/ThcOx family dehydrogenase [Rhizobium sp. rho-1.1]WFS26312.1 SagB/ThcOx family dehydrogenase [Rhizobium rhododendri]
METLSEKERTVFRYRRARALSYFVKNGEVVVFNFLTNRSFACNLRCLEVLLNSEEWRPLNELFSITHDFHTSSLVEEIVQLFSLTALVVEGDFISEKDSEYDETWEWGSVTAQLHFSSQDNLTVSDQMAAEIQILRSKSQPSPPLMDLQPREASISLPRFQIDSELKAVMRTRRSIRAFLDTPLQLPLVADALYAGLGVTDIVSTEVGDHPLRMTPSPGARNAYEGYIFARKVSGLLEDRFYHYNAFHHALELIELHDPMPTMEAMFAENQPWVAKASFIIFLVAHFERVMWKYINGSAYAHTFVEAGHIAQNMMLILSKQGVVVNPAGAIGHSLIERAIGETDLTHSVVYALAVGYPDTSDDYVAWLAPEFSIRDGLLSKIHAQNFHG